MSEPRVRVAAVAAQGPSSPAFRVRVGLLRAELAAYGVDIDGYPLFSADDAARFYGGSAARRLEIALRARRRLGRQLAGIDPDVGIALVQQRADLLPGLRLERAAHSGRRLVWDVDDAIWFRHRRGPLTKGVTRKVEWLASKAEHVIAANRVLADHLRDLNDAVTIVPSTVETRGLPVRRHADGPEVVLGWIGSFSTAPYLAAVRGVVVQISRSLPGRLVRLLVVGGTVSAIPTVEVECVPWSVEAERAALSRIDVGLVPQPDTPWTRGKSAYKAIQYMASGIPLVADDVGVVSTHVGDGGIVVSDADGWVDALLRLARDPDLRQQVGEHGRRRAEREFSVERWAPVVAAILRGDA